jgi:hypothetical protein
MRLISENTEVDANGFGEKAKISLPDDFRRRRLDGNSSERRGSRIRHLADQVTGRQSVLNTQGRIACHVQEM